MAISTLSRSPALGAAFLAEILATLVKTESVNPGTSESAIAGVIIEWLGRTSAEVSVVEFAPGRPSIAAVVRGTTPGPTLVLNGHMDTVPIDDESLWTTDPFGAEIKDGFLFGRGACDMKAGLAVQIAVAHYLDSLPRSQFGGSLVLHFAAGEERGEPGTLSLLNAGFGGDYGITTEPTGLKVATATRGTAHFSLHVKGRSVHASQAQLGRNPIWFLPRILDILNEYDHEVRRLQHSLLPGGSCTPTVIRAGVKENAVPDRCDITLDRRLLPGETAEGVKADLEGRIASIKQDDPTFDFDISTLVEVEPAEIDSGSDFVRQVLRTVEQVTARPAEIWGAPFSSDVRNLVNDGGIQAVTFGPGDVGESHCPDERVSIKEMEAAALIIGKVATDLLTDTQRAAKGGVRWSAS
jgi:succinyl-diaminopimelate desuccinylase